MVEIGSWVHTKWVQTGTVVGFLPDGACIIRDDEKPPLDSSYGTGYLWKQALEDVILIKFRKNETLTSKHLSKHNNSHAVPVHVIGYVGGTSKVYRVIDDVWGHTWSISEDDLEPVDGL